MVSVGKKVTVSCLDCDNSIQLDFQPVVGQIITCPSCDAELEVTSVNPIELDFYFEGWDEDWDDDDDDDLDEDWEEDEDWDEEEED
jgi:lysine biosynthesis protein LysW